MMPGLNEADTCRVYITPALKAAGRCDPHWRIAEQHYFADGQSWRKRGKALAVERKNGEIISHIRKKPLIETPEERVRQEYVCVLVNEYGYSLDQMAEEIPV